jgi:hypothetical protein
MTLLANFYGRAPITHVKAVVPRSAIVFRYTISLVH